MIRKMASAAVKNTLNDVAKMARRPTVQELRNTVGILNMPTRAIAAVLLRHSRPMKHGDLCTEASEYGLFRSKRHFKHVLKMMKLQRRIKVSSMGPAFPRSPKLAFSVNLTKRGEAIYTRYLGGDVQSPIEEENKNPPSLANAMQEPSPANANTGM